MYNAVYFSYLMTELTLSAHPIYKAAVVSVQIEFLSTKKVLEEWKKLTLQVKEAPIIDVSKTKLDRLRPKEPGVVDLLSKAQ